MRGKKADPIFVSEFIQESISLGAETPDQIVQRAQQMVHQIDEEIKTIEYKKMIRSKLLDVISSFEKQTKDKVEESKLLSLFSLEYPDECKEICEAIEDWIVIENKESLSATERFCFKQLVEQNIIKRFSKNKFCKGDRFDDYMKLVLRR